MFGFYAARPIEDERQLSDEARHIRQLEQLLEQKDGEMGKLRHVSAAVLSICTARSPYDLSA